MQNTSGDVHDVAPQRGRWRLARSAQAHPSTPKPPKHGCANARRPMQGLPRLMLTVRAGGQVFIHEHPHIPSRHFSAGAQLRQTLRAASAKLCQCFEPASGEAARAWHTRQHATHHGSAGVASTLGVLLHQLASRCKRRVSAGAVVDPPGNHEGLLVHLDYEALVHITVFQLCSQARSW